MGMVVQHNMNAISAYNQVNANVSGLKKSSEKLSSGYRINRAGDDAAGLAISEKMRSQIRGLNQASRNAQDGVSMIQTFEGAAEETHTILQRMKELATESANGTYDNSTDRSAIQLEFNQLNDELNQIADTDFNGTIVLNGGTMADGLNQVDNEFDYTNKKSQLTDEVTNMLDATITEKQKAVDKAEAALKANKYDLSSDGKAVEWDTVDNNSYTKTQADGLWQELGLTTDGQTTSAADVSKGSEVSVTFEYDATNSKWVAKSGTVKAGESTTGLTDDQLDVFQATAVTNANAAGNGGFKVESKTNAVDLGNAIFDATQVKNGDTVTLTYTNAAVSKYAPTNIGFNADTRTVTTTKGTIADPTVAVAATLTDANMTDAVKAGLDGLKDVAFEATYDGANANELASAKLGGQTIDLTKTGSSVTINGVDYWITLDNKNGTSTGPTTFTVGLANDTKNGLVANTNMMTITISAAGAAGDNVGSVSGNISISAYDYDDPTGNVTIKPGDDPKLESSNELKAAVDTAKAELKDAQANKKAVLSGGKNDDENWENIKAYYGTAKGVSVSDSFDNSTARLTYANNITLQVGARSKDSVNFTFNYNMDDTADMGELQANLNLSARAEGLNTENLSLATADDANNAIDQIDKAINKVSMVRASFGSIQNRLEYKIDNLTTTSTNLTEAESNIRDTDMASEMMNYTKYNILQQAAQSMLAQANQQPQSILQLLG